MAAEEVIVKVKVDAGDSAKKIAEVNDGVEKLKENTEKSGKAAEKSKGAFGSLGDAIKSLSIASVVIKVFGKFAEILGGNSKITKVLAVATEALSIIVSDFVNFLTDNTKGVIDFFKNAFENPTKFAKDLGNAIKDNIIERFNSVLETIGFLGTAFKKLFKGDFDGAVKAAKDASQEFVDVLTGVDDSAKKIGDLAEKVVDYTKKTFKSAQANVELQNQAELAAVKLGGLIEKYDRLAERERQIRDDTTKSIKDRIDANDRLAKVLELSQKTQLQQADLLIAAADNNLKKDKGNIEFQKSAIEARNQRAAVEAQIEGFRSEQIINQIGLALEQQTLEKSRTLNLNTLVIAQKKANVELIVDEQEKAIQKRKILDEEGELEIKRLTDNISLYKDGTQAKVDAENELATKKQEIENGKLVADNEIRSIYYNRQLEDLQFIQDNELAKFEVKRTAIDDEIQANKNLYKTNLISEREYNKRVKELSKERKAIDKAERESKENNANAIGGILGALSGLAEQGTALQKGLALGQVAIDTATSISSLMAVSEAHPLNTLTFGGAGIAQYATGIIRILANVAQAKSILSQVPGGGASSVPISIPSATSAPITPTFTPADATRLDQTSLNTISNVVARAYVVESDISGTQKRIKRIENAARI